MGNKFFKFRYCYRGIAVSIFEFYGKVGSYDSDNIFGEKFLVTGADFDQVLLDFILIW